MNSLSRIVIVPLLIVAAISVWGFGPISAERICYAQGPAVVAPTIKGPLTAGDTTLRGAFARNYDPSVATFFFLDRNDQWVCGVQGPVRAGDVTCNLDQGKFLRLGQQVKAQLFLRNPDGSFLTKVDSATLTVQAFRAVPPTIKGPLKAGDTTLRGSFARNYDPFVATFFFLDHNNQWLCQVQGPVQAGDVTCNLDQGKFLREGQQVKAQLFLRYPDNSFLTKVDSATLTVQADPRAKKK